MTQSQGFFDKSLSEHSSIKKQIVVDYFKFWAKTIGKSSTNLVYLDLFAGEIYKDKELCTGLEITHIASKDIFLKKNLQIILNDKDKKKVACLENFISENEFNNRFNHKPLIFNIEVNESTPELIKNLSDHQIFCFIDPCGYVGLTLELVKTVISSWGCDCVVFFSTSGIYRNIGIKRNQRNLKEIYGERIFDNLLQKIASNKHKKVELIIDEFRKACKFIGADYFLPFQINFSNSYRVSHHIIYLSKHPLGFKIMKDIMAKYSVTEDGIPLFLTSDGWSEVGDIQNFIYSNRMNNLKNKLLSEYCNQELKVASIINNIHRKGELYTDKNIKTALIELENENAISVIAASKRRKIGTMSDNNIIKFPD